jgi:hypothetical protein
LGRGILHHFEESIFFPILKNTNKNISIIEGNGAEIMKLVLIEDIGFK